jgi:hypothetical protein
MAQKKKKKKKGQSPVPQSLNRAECHNKALIEKAYTTIRKILQVYGLDPDILNVFTKNQRLVICYLKAGPPRFKAEEGHRIPRRLLDFASESTHHFMRTNYFGDKNLGLTYLDLATYGISFILTVIAERDFSTGYTPKQEETLKLIAASLGDNNRIEDDLKAIGGNMLKTTLMISKVNFRVYGHRWDIKPNGTGFINSMVYMSSEESKTIHFTYNGKERIAFRIQSGRIMTEPPQKAKIGRDLIFNTKEQSPVDLEIYIQSHALHRSKERMDIFSAHKRNYYIMDSLLFMHRVAKHPSTEVPILECAYVDEEDNDNVVRFGYFHFIVRDDKLIVMTFLPLTSPDTWEGIYLQKHLGLQKEDIIFLGMDKLSFFLTVDFEQIPTLKKALEKTEISKLIQFAAEDPDINFVIDPKKTQMVKKFFEQKNEDDVTNYGL